MKPILLAAALLAPVAAFAQPKGVVAADKLEAIVTVTKVDPKARTVTFRGPKGNVQTLKVPPESQNLERVKPGDRFKMTYAEAMVLALTKGGEPATQVEEMVQVAPKGAKPGGFAVKTYKISAVVDAIDYNNRYVALRGPKGNTLALPVSPEVKNLESVMVGDKLSIVYSEALAIEMVAQEKPKKSAAKK